MRETLEPHVKLWLERNGRIVMSDYRLRLLALIAESGSLADAAQQMGLSYRRAWGKIKELEQNLGLALVESSPGGPGGGHSSITAEGRRLLERFAAWQERVERVAREAYGELFTPEPRVNDA